MSRGPGGMVVVLGLVALAASSWSQVNPGESKLIVTATSKDFGSVPRGVLCLHQFTIFNPFDRPMKIASVRTSCVCASASVDKREIAPGESATLNVSVDTGKYVGHRVFTIFVLLEQPVVQELQFVVQGHSREDVSLSPNQLAFGRILRGQSAEASVLITRYGSPDWQITAVENDNAYIQPSLQEVRRDTAQLQYRLTAKLRPDVPVGSWYAELWLRGSDGSRILVPLTVEVESALVVTPKEVHLGRVAAGVTIERRIIVRSAKAFRILKVQAADPGLEFVWQPDETKTAHLVTIRYRTPASAGEVRQVIRIVTDLPADNEIEVPFVAQVQ